MLTMNMILMVCLISVILFTIFKVIYFFYKSKQLVYEGIVAITCAKDNNVSLDLIHEYCMALQDYGLDSSKIKYIRRLNDNNKAFLDFANTIDNLRRKKENLNGY